MVVPWRPNLRLKLGKFGTFSGGIDRVLSGFEEKLPNYNIVYLLSNIV
jgi:hypothetical protein